jgi:hypothetical protein
MLESARVRRVCDGMARWQQLLNNWKCAVLLFYLEETPRDPAVKSYLSALAQMRTSMRKLSIFMGEIVALLEEERRPRESSSKDRPHIQTSTDTRQLLAFGCITEALVSAGLPKLIVSLLERQGGWGRDLRVIMARHHLQRISIPCSQRAILAVRNDQQKMLSAGFDIPVFQCLDLLCIPIPHVNQVQWSKPARRLQLLRYTTEWVSDM